LLQSAEDVLSVMAQEGIFMDDLGTPPSDPDLWRRFAQGERGTAICDIGTVDDQAAIALVRGRLAGTRSGLAFLLLARVNGAFG